MDDPVVIRFLTDHGAFPVWDAGGVECYPEGVEISAELESALEKWAGNGAGWDGWDTDPPDYSGPRPGDDDWGDYQAWIRRGRELLEQLQTELGEGFRVVCGDARLR